MAPQVTGRSVTVDGTTLEKALAAMEHAKTSYEKFLGSIPREHFSAKGLEEHIAGFAATDAARAVDKAVAQMEQRVESATAKIAKIEKTSHPPAMPQPKAGPAATGIEDQATPGQDGRWWVTHEEVGEAHHAGHTRTA